MNRSMQYERKIKIILATNQGYTAIASVVLLQHVCVFNPKVKIVFRGFHLLYQYLFSLLQVLYLFFQPDLPLL